MRTRPAAACRAAILPCAERRSRRVAVSKHPPSSLVTVMQAAPRFKARGSRHAGTNPQAVAAQATHLPFRKNACRMSTEERQVQTQTRLCCHLQPGVLIEIPNFKF